MPRAAVPLSIRLWQRVQVGAPHECWEWTGPTRFGYGNVAGVYQPRPDGKKGRTPRLGAHRVSWELHNGPIPPGMCVLHSCDNPPCVNPAHLFLGTKGDNNRDRVAKGRGPIGEAHPNARLSEDALVMAQALVDYGFSHTRIAPVFGVSQTTLSRALRGESWRHPASERSA